MPWGLEVQEPDPPKAGRSLSCCLEGSFVFLVSLKLLLEEGSCSVGLPEDARTALSFAGSGHKAAEMGDAMEKEGSQGSLMSIQSLL